jgi:hypothetical protein
MMTQATLAKLFKQHTPRTSAECNQMAKRFLFLRAHPDANPLRALLKRR